MQRVGQTLRAWDAALAGWDAGRSRSRRQAVLDLGVPALLGAGVVALSVWLGQRPSLPRSDREYLIWLVMVFALYGVAAVWMIRRRPAARGVLGLIALVSLAAQLAFVPQPPTASNDIYRYVWDGRVQAAGINPYRYPPADPALDALRTDDIYPNMNRPRKPTIYPPVAEHVFHLLYRIYPGSVTWTKLAFSLLNLVIVGLLVGLLHRLGRRPEWVVLYAWHPLLLLEVGHNGHVDVIAVGFLALALRARLAGQVARTGLWLACGALVKFYAIVALPALLFRSLRRDLRVAGALALTVVLAYLPFLGVGRRVFGYLRGYTVEEGIVSGRRFLLLQWAERLAHRVWPEPVWPGWLPFDAGQGYKVLLLLVMAGLALWCRQIASRDAAGVVAGAALLYATLFVLSTPSYPWYALLLLGLVPLQRGRVLLPSLAVPSAATLLYLQWWWIGGAHWATYLGYGIGAAALAVVAFWSLGERVARRTPPPRPLRRRLTAWLPAHTPPPVARGAGGEVNLYDRYSRLYAFCRERLFRDHTALIDSVLWPEGPPSGSRLLEIGCGPGFYARRFAARYRHLQAAGIDCSAVQIGIARERARRAGLTNCRFEQADACALPWSAPAVGAVVVSRLLMVVPDALPVVREIHRVLLPHGRCLIIEPRARRSALVPQHCLNALLRCERLFRRVTCDTRPAQVSLRDEEQLRRLLTTQDWMDVRIWSDRQYHYAYCARGPSEPYATALAAD